MAEQNDVYNEFSKNKHVSNMLKYYEKNYKKLIFIPIIILVLSLCFLGYKYASTGDFVDKGISLKGGTTVTIPSGDVNTAELKSYLSSVFPNSDISVRTLANLGEITAVEVSASDITSGEMLTILKARFGDLEYSVEEMGSSLGGSFFRETIIAIIFAFLFMAGVVFFFFREPVPSLAIVLSALSNMVVTLAVISMLGVKLSTAGVAAFLMLIGYSVDTNILLSTKVLKRDRGLIIERIISGMKTGFLMTLTTFTAVLIAYIFSQSESLSQIMLILMIGLLMDVLNTWIQNAGILRMYLEKKGKK
ncbi:MAG: protein translocase subunit SecF [Candidatus Nanoarchaeia archaeon]|nr:protein translocase subunit SecF [Candidatus Nanoarchaeia archaeon]